jgi:hypothetical protein
MIRSIHIDKYVAIIKIDEILEELKDLNFKEIKHTIFIYYQGLAKLKYLMALNYNRTTIMTCEALVIGSVAGLALTAAVLSFQVITDRKADARNTLKLKEKGRLIANTITT